MKKIVLSQDKVDKLVVVERSVARPTLFKVGINDVGFQVAADRKPIWQYSLWCRVLERAFCQKLKTDRPTYKDVTCCDEWLSFANFLGWCNKEVDYKGKPVGMALDKDIVVKGNKIYSPEACSFVPQDVNKLLTDSGATRGEWPVGVNINKEYGRYQARLRQHGCRTHLGYYDTPEEAFLAYKVAKEAQIRAVANQYKDVLKPAVYESLMNWEIEP